ncbi:unnamed protein product [Arctogadus glacialis]
MRPTNEEEPALSFPPRLLASLGPEFYTEHWIPRGPRVQARRHGRALGGLARPRSQLGPPWTDEPLSGVPESDGEQTVAGGFISHWAIQPSATLLCRTIRTHLDPYRIPTILDPPESSINPLCSADVRSTLCCALGSTTSPPVIVTSIA